MQLNKNMSIDVNGGTCIIDPCPLHGFGSMMRPAVRRCLYGCCIGYGWMAGRSRFQCIIGVYLHRHDIYGMQNGVLRCVNIWDMMR